MYYSIQFKDEIICRFWRKKTLSVTQTFFKAGICLFVVSWWFFIFTFLGFFKNILPSKLCYNKFIKCSHKNLLVSFFIIQWKYALFNYSLIQVGWGCNFNLNHVSSLGASECQGTEEGVQFPDLGDTQVIQVVQNNLQQNNIVCTVNKIGESKFVKTYTIFPTLYSQWMCYQL